MDTIVLSAVIGEDRRLVIDLPPDTPTGMVDLLIKPHVEAEPYVETIPPNPDRERIRAKLLAAGLLVTDIRAPEGTIPLSPEEILRIGTLPEGAPSLDKMIDEERNEG